MNITNQKPVSLAPTYTDDLSNDMDIPELLTEITSQLYEPLVATQPVVIQGDSGNDILAADITQLIIDCCGEDVDVASETITKTILASTLADYTITNMLVKDVFAVQSATKEKLPEPTTSCIYSPAQDIIPSAKHFLAGTGTYDMFFASLAYYARPVTCGFYFSCEAAFEDFKTWLAGQVPVYQSLLSTDTLNMLSDIQTLKLDGLTESLILRNKDGEAEEPYSFARLIMKCLMTYTKTVSPAECGILPFTIDELVCPKSIVLVNVERHAKSSSKQIAEEWKLINTSLANKPTVLSHKKITKLTSAVRSLQKMSNIAGVMAQQNLAKAAKVKFSRKIPSSFDIARAIKKVLDHMAFVNTSANTFKSTKMSFAVPNRRDPDNFNKQGKMVSTKYKPNIHLYIDTSGSITEADYENSVKSCIKLAKALNIDMYFNSFSHVMSQTTQLKLQNKSIKALYKEFQSVPKVTGGTNYAQIWEFINKSPKRRRELSIIISDFEYRAPGKFIKHPKNLYYVPCSNQDIARMSDCAAMFVKSMQHNDADIRRHILF